MHRLTKHFHSTNLLSIDDIPEAQNICIAFEQRRPNASMLVQHYTNVIQMICVYWETRFKLFKRFKPFLPHPRVKVSIVGSLRDREVACSASDRQGSNFESCVWRTVSSQSSHHPQEVLLAQFSLYVHKGGLKPDSFHFIFLYKWFVFTGRPVSSCETNGISSEHAQREKWIKGRIGRFLGKGWRRNVLPPPVINRNYFP